MLLESLHKLDDNYIFHSIFGALFQMCSNIDTRFDEKIWKVIQESNATDLVSCTVYIIT